ncbi:hypothetical protein DACRYDRAFT_25440 [Dacryopinax primogenitus]|uniref:CFEM domain-containing protein n=1 Tax=Dacryopinax primogenitus (strain DJM 731) TaxID=1858805 RepID=M5FQK7_DACPD|nr:uncharacterized protein DACRYDRAFT_25440 [Dacryopinax primogenitus]EJT97034.1 hypothetical protein DACRYDRAFT_25440 [Dacryopinax primogenitus]
MQIALVFLTLLAAVAAQNTTSSAAGSAPTGGIPACVLACSQQASTVANCSFLDTSCSCLNQQFQAAANNCLGANCSASDIAAGLALQNATCSGVAGSLPVSGSVNGSSASSSGSGSGSGSSTAGGSTSSPATSSPAATHSSAAGMAKPVSVTGLVSAIVAVVGMGIGAVLVA